MTPTMTALTTKQLLTAIGFKNVRTLQRWRKRNLVPPPTLQRHPNGQGMTWMWPAWTIRHIDAIKKRLAAGESMDDIARTLSGDWQAEAKKWVHKRYDFKAAMERSTRHRAIDSFARWVSDTAYYFLRDIGVERPGRIDDKIRKEISKTGFINEALELLRQGCTPILIVTKDQVTLAADFMLASAFSNADIGAQPMLIVPIRDAFTDAFAQAEPELPKVATLVPALHVTERRRGKERVLKYQLGSNWKFTLDS